MRQFDRKAFSFTDAVQFVAFAAMCFSYALYMSDYLAQSVYLFTLFGLGSILVVRLTMRTVLRGESARGLFFSRTAGAMFAVAVIFVVWTGAREFFATGTISTTAVSESTYLVVPALIALGVANTVRSWRMIDIYMTVLLARYVLYFFLNFDIALAELRLISWSGSASPFETSFAHDLLMLECYFLVRGKYGRVAIAATFTMLGLKRASFILAPAVVALRRYLTAPVRPRRNWISALWLTGVASPFIVMATYSEAFTSWFYGQTHRDFNDFVSGRQSIYVLVTQYVSRGYGFGWVNKNLATYTEGILGTVWNSSFHNDTVRLYLEVTIVGLALYLGALVSAAVWSRISFVIVGYSMFVLVTSRLVTQMSFWVTAMLVLALIERAVRERAQADELSDEGERERPHARSAARARRLV